jgi:hypothetical protein
MCFLLGSTTADGAKGTNATLEFLALQIRLDFRDPESRATAQLVTRDLPTPECAGADSQTFGGFPQPVCSVSLRRNLLHCN